METKETPAALEVVSPLQEITRAEIDMQISTAKKYKRSLETFRQKAMSMATNDIEVAASCFYKLKRRGADGDVFIEGPSIRLAEIIANAWGNIRFGARIVGEGQKEVTAQGVCHDLEQNVMSTIEVSRRITTKTGTRFGDDMVQVTKNAACSIALRNSVFKIIPMSYVKPIMEACKKVAVGSAKTCGERRQAMLDIIMKMTVTKEQILTFLEVKSIEDIGLKEIETMIGVHTAIKNGDTTVDEQFKPGKAGPDEMPRKKGEAPASGSGPVPSGYEPSTATADGLCKAKDCSKEIRTGTPVLINTKTKGLYHFDCAEI